MIVYVIQSEAGPVKIGVSKHPASRLDALTQCQPFEAKLVHSISGAGICAREIERAAHVLLAAHHRRGEWFDVTPEQAIEAIAQAIEQIKNLGEQTPETNRAFPVQKLIYITKRQAALVKDYRFAQRLESDNEAIRQLIDRGLESTLADDDASNPSYDPGPAPKAKETAK